MNYWKECISEALEEVGIVVTDDQISSLSKSLQFAHEMYGETHGHDCIPNPMETRMDENNRQHEQLMNEAKAREDLLKKNIADRYNTDVWVRLGATPEQIAQMQAEVDLMTSKAAEIGAAIVAGTPAA